MNYFLHLVVYWGVYAVLASSLGLVVGFCGRTSFAHVAYFTIGAYTHALATVKFGVGFGMAMGTAVVVSAAFSLVLSIPSWRMRADDFTLLSIAVQGMVFQFVRNWNEPSSLFTNPGASMGNALGIAGIPRPVVFGFEFNTVARMAGLSTVLAVVVLALLHRCLRGPWGRLLKSMRDDETALRALGKRVGLAKCEALGLSCGLAGAAGALYAAYLGFIDPGSATFDEAILVLSMVLIGGAGNLRGPVIGAAAVILLPEILRFLGANDILAAHLRLIAYGIALLVVVHFRPQGMFGEHPARNLSS